MSDPPSRDPGDPAPPPDHDGGPVSADSDAWAPRYPAPPPALPDPAAPVPPLPGAGFPPLGTAHPSHPTFQAPPGFAFPAAGSREPVAAYPGPAYGPAAPALPAYRPAPQPPAGWDPTSYPPVGWDPTAYPPPGYRNPNWPHPPYPASGQHRPASTTQRRGGLIGGLLAGLFAFLKYGLVLFKFGKFGATAISMLIALWLYTLIWGWRFALGVVLLIFVHEMGHFLVSKALKVPVTAPLFIPFLGAFTTHKNLEADRRVEAIIAIGGPLFGFAATLLLYLFAITQPEVTFLVGLAFALSYFGFFITLLNLVPMVPLDGGRIAGAVSKWTNLVGVAIFGSLVLLMLVSGTSFNFFLVLIFVVGAYTVWGRFKQAREGREPPPLPARTKAWIGAAYIALVVFSALGMSLAHGALINASYITVS